MKEDAFERCFTDVSCQALYTAFSYLAETQVPGYFTQTFPAEQAFPYVFPSVPQTGLYSIVHIIISHSSST
jgi:hypothetical protein